MGLLYHIRSLVIYWQHNSFPYRPITLLHMQYNICWITRSIGHIIWCLY